MHFEQLITKLKNSASILPIQSLLSATAFFMIAPTISLAAPDACPVGAGGILQCSGNQSAGIAFSDVNGVHVFNLNQDINPASPLSGIKIINAPGGGPSKPIVITVDPTTIKINSVGGIGIEANSVDGSINILNSADITSKENAIEAQSNKANVTIAQHGRIVSSNGNGIFAFSNDLGTGGSISIINTGDIEAAAIAGTGIIADARNNITINHDTSLNTSNPNFPLSVGLKANSGIFAKSLQGMIEIKTKGKIETIGTAISTENAGPGKTEVFANSSITSTAGRAIDIQANGGGEIELIASSIIDAAAGGVSVRSTMGTAKTSILSSGSIKSSIGFGIEVLNDFTATGDIGVTINFASKIEAQLDAVHVESRGNIRVDLGSRSHLKSATGSAIRINNLVPPAVGVGAVNIGAFGSPGAPIKLETALAETIFANGKSVALNLRGAEILSHGAPAVAVFGQDSLLIDLTETTITTDPTGLANISAINAVLFGPGDLTIRLTGEGSLIKASGSGVEATSLAGNLSVSIDSRVSRFAQRNAEIETGEDGLHLFNQVGTTTVSFDHTILKAAKNGINTLNLNPTMVATPRQNINLKFSEIKAGQNGIVSNTTRGQTNISMFRSEITAGKNGIEATDALDVTMQLRSKIAAKDSGIKVTTAGFAPPANFVGLRASIRPGNSISGKTGIELKDVVTSIITLEGTLTGSQDAIVSSGNAADFISVFTHGIINGNIKLAENPGAFTNDRDRLTLNSGGRLNTGAIVDIGGGTLISSGTISPGGIGAIQTTNITVGGQQFSRGFTNESYGRLEIDLKKQNVSDKILVNGRWNLRGTVLPNLISMGSAGTFDIVSGDTALLGTKKITVRSTPGLQYGLQYISGPGATTILQLTAKRVALGGLTGGSNNNAGIFGQHLDKGVKAPGEHPLFQQYINGLAAQPTKSKLQQGLKQGAGEANVAPTALSRAASQAFSGHLMSCPVNSQSMYSAIDEGQCAWVNGITRYVERDGDAGTIEFAERASGVAAGFQSKINGNWFLGAALSYQDVRISTDVGASSKGERFHGGAVAKYVNGANKIAFSAYGGAGWFDSNRAITIPFAANAASSQKVQYIGANLRLSHTLKPSEDAAWSITPMVDFAANYSHTNGFAETGAGALNLTYSDSHDTIFSISPAVEFTHESDLKEGGSLRAYARFGATYTNDNNSDFNVTMQGAPSGSFESFTGFDGITGDIHIGLDFVKDKWFVRLQGDGKFGETTRAIGANLKVGVSF